MERADAALSRLEKMRCWRPEIDARIACVDGGFIDSATAARITGASVEALYKRARRGAVIAIRTSAGRLAFPAFQFISTDVSAGVKRVVSRLPMDDPRDWLLFLMTECAALEGRSPLEAIQLGMIEEAESLARRMRRSSTL
jgi:hypothetical protein